MKASASARTARDWEFLQPWFVTLSTRLSPSLDSQHDSSHPARIGVDVSDWWIKVRLRDIHDAPDELRAVREALLLVGAFGQLSHEYCMQYLQSFALFHRAPHMDLDNNDFRPRFIVELGEILPPPGREEADETAADEDTTPVDLSLVFNSLLSMGKLSVEFRRDWVRVLDLLERVGQPAIDLKAIEICIDIDCEDLSHGDQTRHLRAAIKAVEMTQQASNQWIFEGPQKRLALGPVFAVVEMSLVQYFNDNTSLPYLEAVQDLLHLGVRFNTIELASPLLLELPPDEVSARVCGWADVVRLVAGQSNPQGESLPSVRRLIIPAVYQELPLVSSLFSAVICARNIREIQVLTTRGGRENMDRENEEATDVPDFWRWMACVLFQESTNSVESLTLVSPVINCESAGIVEEFHRSDRRLKLLAQSLLPNAEIVLEGGTSRTSTVTISSGASITVHHGHRVQELTLVKNYSATVISDDEDSSDVILLVPGFGICSTNRGNVPSKRARVERTSASTRLLPPETVFRNLVIVGQQDFTAVERLVTLVAPSLTGLSLHVPGLAPQIMKKCIAMCPHLESLSIGRMSLPSLGFLLEAYGNGGRISSLTLLGCQFNNRDTQLVQVVDQLKDPETAITKTLRRLAIRHIAFPDPLCDAICDMLESNQSLTHFMYSEHFFSGHKMMWGVERHHGQLLRDAPRELDSAVVLAFLSVVRANRDAFPLDENVQRLVLDYAAKLQRRTVVSGCH